MIEVDIPDGLTIMTELPTASWNPSNKVPKTRVVYITDKRVLTYSASHSERAERGYPYHNMMVMRAVIKELVLAVDSKPMWQFFQQLHNWDPA